MAVSLVYETHQLTLDNERGIATGWLSGELSPKGREGAVALGERRSDDGIACVFTSDLKRAVDTAEIAFRDADIDVRQDIRLRECNYGDLNGKPLDHLEPRTQYIDKPFPGGESYVEAIDRTRSFLEDIVGEFDGKRILVIGHSAQRFALDHLLLGRALKDLIEEPFAWREGWEYVLS